MTDEDAQRPEGALLKSAMESRGISFRALAAEVGLSEARVRNIVNGYQAVGQGQRISISGPEDTIAKMALALGIDPDAMENVGRSDAAHAMRRRLPGGPLPEWAQGEDGDDHDWRRAVVQHEEIREWAEDPENFLPPDSILEYFDTEVLATELQSRIARAERELGRYYWQVGPEHSLVEFEVERRLGNLATATDGERAGLDRAVSQASLVARVKGLAEASRIEFSGADADALEATFDALLNAIREAHLRGSLNRGAVSAEINHVLISNPGTAEGLVDAFSAIVDEVNAR